MIVPRIEVNHRIFDSGDRSGSFVHVILAAQAFTLVDGEVTIATTNVGYLFRFVPAQLWCDITP